MFVQRLITALILVPLALLLIFYGPPKLLGGIILVVFIAANRECFQLIPIEKLSTQIAFIAVSLLSLWACTYLFSYWLYLGLILWCFIILAILTFPASQNYWGQRAIVAGACLVLLPLFLLSSAQLYFLPEGKALVVYLLFLIWASDVGAYLSGKLIGKHKLIPQVSPGKSWEGVAGGIALAAIVAGIGSIYFQPEAKVYWFLLALITVIISIFGDLFISILKRRCHLKDTGTLIPGHGGVLDRLDSLIAAVPVFYFGLTLG